MGVFAADDSFGLPCSKKRKMVQSDSCLAKALGDSISQIVTSAKNIKAYVWKSENHKDIKINVKRLNKSQRGILHFILADSCMVKSNAIVYGKFIPCLGFVLKKSCSKKVYIDVDLGLGKWAVSDSKGKLLKQFDIEGNDLLRFSTMLYPSDKFIMVYTITDRANEKIYAYNFRFPFCLL